MNRFLIQAKTQADDNIGGFTEEWSDLKEVFGYLDLVTGTDLNSVQNAIIEQSTHVLILPEFISWVNADMRIVDDQKRFYLITYADDPMGIHHHNELYCKFGGVING